jgi:hypothetical protein
MPKQSLKSALKTKPSRNDQIGPKKSTKKKSQRYSAGLPPTAPSYPSIGAQIGDGLQKWGTSLFNRIMGTGDYILSPNLPSIQKNDLFASAAEQPPSFAGEGHSFLFEHSEYIQDITSSSVVGAFNTQSFTVNPTNPITFPWLSGVAQNFENYEIEGMIFRFVSTSGTAVSSTNSQIGSIMATYVYDAMDPPFINKSQLLQYDGVVDARSSDNFLVGVECARDSTALRTLYNGLPPPGADPKFYNHGKLHIASQGMQSANQVIGELWVHYKIRMKITKDLNNDLQSLGAFATSGISSTNWMGVNPTFTGNLIASVSSGVLTISNLTPGIIYQVSTVISGTGITGFTAAPSITGGTLYNGYFNYAGSDAAAFNTTNINNLLMFTATSSVATVTLAATIASTTLTTSNTRVLPLDINTL